MTMKERPFAILANTVRQSRIENKMSQRQLSHALGKSEGYVGHLESGKFRPTVTTLKTLSVVLGLFYGRLALAAGYISQKELDLPIGESQLDRLNELKDLTNDEWNTVKEFASILRLKRNGKNGAHRTPITTDVRI